MPDPLLHLDYVVTENCVSKIPSQQIRLLEVLISYAESINFPMIYHPNEINIPEIT